MKTLISFVLTLVFIVTSVDAKEVNATMVVDNMIQAYGGEEEVKQLNIYEQFWFVHNQKNDINSTEYRMVMMPDYLRTKRKFPDRVETSVLDKKNGTIMLDGTIFKAVDSKLAAMKFQMMGLLSPVELKKIVDTLTITEDEEYYLFSITKDELQVEYFVSKKSNFLHKVSTTITVDDKKVVLSTIFDHYEEFNGVMLANQEIQLLNDTPFQVANLQETRFQNPLR